MKCQECGMPVKGRSDKRFCDDACRNAYHNRRTQVERRELQYTHQKLRRNYRLLRDYDNSGIDRVGLEELLRQGFDPDCCTGLRSGRNPHPRKIRRWYKKSGDTYRYRLIYTLAFRVEKGEVLISSSGN